MYVRACVRACVNRLEVDVACLSQLLFTLVRHSLSLNQELVDLARQIGQVSPGNPFCLLPQYWDYGQAELLSALYVGTGD